uniref:Cytochrome b561 domain-containing protein n=1 Tax=Ascaris lumbricoides TaxID=6252 RepID=A0A0M3IT43_ASCLU
MKHSGCQLNVLWLAWSVLQIFAVNLTFYGMKNTNWKLFLPHMIFRLLCFIMLATLIIIFFTASFFYMHAEETHPFGVYFIVLGTITTLFSAFWIYIMVCQFRCCQFVKRSAETGFSVSNTRPLGPPTLSLSDARPATTPAIAPPIRQLPPLRHAYHRRAPPVYGEAASGDFPVKTG